MKRKRNQLAAPENENDSSTKRENVASVWAIRYSSLMADGCHSIPASGERLGKGNGKGLGWGDSGMSKSLGQLGKGNGRGGREIY